jgi:hypothetical protein
MRALVALGLSVFLVLSAGLPHIHTGGPHGAEACAVCVARNADAARDETPDVAPVAILAGKPVAVPGLPPVYGAPLGAVPGQSPPAAA